MFGYVNINKAELKLREYNLYKAFYCGLCKTLHDEYGVGSKLLLSYDCTFIAILLSLARDDMISVRKRRCNVNPLISKVMVENSAPLEFAAAMNVMLAYFSLDDGKRDDKNPVKAVGAGVFKSAVRKAAAKYPEAYTAVRQALLSLDEAEKDNVADLDIPANASARILADSIPTFISDEDTKRLIRVLCFGIGRFIYIADAWCDRKKDARKKSYNPVNLTGADKTRVMHLMYMALSMASEAYELLAPAQKNELCSIMENILIFGCPEVAEAVLEDRFLNRRKKERNKISGNS